VFTKTFLIVAIVMFVLAGANFVARLDQYETCVTQCRENAEAHDKSKHEIRTGLQTREWPTDREIEAVRTAEESYSDDLRRKLESDDKCIQGLKYLIICGFVLLSVLGGQRRRA
jgi:hypothetical protein